MWRSGWCLERSTVFERFWSSGRNRDQPACTLRVTERGVGMSVDSLREEVRGAVFAEGDEGYEEARAVYNAMIDKRPAVVIGAVDDADVITGVRYAAESGFDLSIRGGGHSVPGFGTNDGGVVIDLERMKGVRVDPEAQTARAQGGVTWGDLD